MPLHTWSKNLLALNTWSKSILALDAWRKRITSLSPWRKWGVILGCIILVVLWLLILYLPPNIEDTYSRDMAPIGAPHTRKERHKVSTLFTTHRHQANSPTKQAFIPFQGAAHTLINSDYRNTRVYPHTSRLYPSQSVTSSDRAQIVEFAMLVKRNPAIKTVAIHNWPTPWIHQQQLQNADTASQALYPLFPHSAVWKHSYERLAKQSTHVVVANDTRGFTDTMHRVPSMSALVVVIWDTRHLAAVTKYYASCQHDVSSCDVLWCFLPEVKVSQKLHQMLTAAAILLQSKIVFAETFVSGVNMCVSACECM